MATTIMTLFTSYMYMTYGAAFMYMYMIVKEHGLKPMYMVTIELSSKYIRTYIAEFYSVDIQFVKHHFQFTFINSIKY